MMQQSYSESIEDLDRSYKARTAHLCRASDKKPIQTENNQCWACGKQQVYHCGVCSKCYQRIRQGRLLLPDLSAYNWDPDRNSHDWHSVARFYRRFFRAAAAAGVTPEQLVTEAMTTAIQRAGT